MNCIHAHWSLPCFTGHGLANQVKVTAATGIRLAPHDPACHLGLPLLRRPCRLALTTTAAAPRPAARFDDLPPKRKKQQYVKPKPKPEPVVQQTRLAKVRAVHATTITITGCLRTPLPMPTAPTARPVTAPLSLHPSARLCRLWQQQVSHHGAPAKISSLQARWQSTGRWSAPRAA